MHARQLLADHDRHLRLSAWARVYQRQWAIGTWTFSATGYLPVGGCLGAVPFMTLGNAMSDADLKSFIDNLCTAMTNYNFPSAGWKQSNEELEQRRGPHFLRVAATLAALGYGGGLGRNFSAL